MPENNLEQTLGMSKKEIIKRLSAVLKGTSNNPENRYVSPEEKIENGMNYNSESNTPENRYEITPKDNLETRLDKKTKEISKRLEEISNYSKNKVVKKISNIFKKFTKSYHNSESNTPENIYEITPEDNLETRLDKMKEQIRKKLDQVAVSMWKNPEYLKKTLSKIDTTIDNMPSGDYNIDFDINITENGTLNVKPNTTLNFSIGKGILCEGTLTAISENKNIKFTSKDIWKNITLEGEKSSASSLQGCIIENGRGNSKHDYMGSGGGILIYNSSPTIRECDIKNNYAHYGGGLNIYGYSSPKIIGNIIENNRAKTGAGIYVDLNDKFKNSEPIILKNSIRKNTSEEGGAGIFCQYNINKNNKLIIEGNKIVNNTATGDIVHIDCENFDFCDNIVRWNKTGKQTIAVFLKYGYGYKSQNSIKFN